MQCRNQLPVSDSPLNLIGTEASGTSVHMARSTIHNGLDPLNIGLPCPVGTSVGVRNLDTEGNALATIITLRHSTAPPICIVNRRFSCATNRRLDMIPENAEKCKHFFTNFLTFFKFRLIFPFLADIITAKTRKR